MALHRAASAFRGVVTALTGATTTSTFPDNGLLTPQEFEQAGDHLVKYFSAWSWQAAQTPHLRDSQLPTNKQYLVITQCVSRYRIADLDRALTEELDTDADAMVVSKADDGPSNDSTAQSPLDTHEHSKNGNATSRPTENANADDLVDDNEACVVAPPDADDPTGSDLRSYTLRVTYNKFFRMPSLWVGGFNSLQEPLTQEEIFEDVAQEYRAKTITLVRFPFAENLYLLEMHPCNHGNIMHRVVRGWKRLGWDPVTEPRVHLTLLVFLKMLSSVIPTISYDFTITVNMLGLLDKAQHSDDSEDSTESRDGSWAGGPHQRG